VHDCVRVRAPQGQHHHLRRGGHVHHGEGRSYHLPHGHRRCQTRVICRKNFLKVETRSQMTYVLKNVLLSVLCIWSRFAYDLIIVCSKNYLKLDE